MSVRIAVIYYSVSGNVRRLAEAVAQGAEVAGAATRLRQVTEVAIEPAGDGKANPPVGDAQIATLDDLEWAGGYAFGTPSRFGTPAGQLKIFLDSAGELWQRGRLADRAVTMFCSAYNIHGGLEATMLALAPVFFHWGSVLVPPGYTDDRVYAAGGNPYGAAYASSGQGPALQTVLEAARHQGERLARYAAVLARLREEASA